MIIIPGSMMLVIWNKQCEIQATFIYAMNSFYHALNSDGRKNMHVDNHGGDFTVELYDTMDLHGAWEVTLVEMSYFGQQFPNVPVVYGEIQLTSSARELYNTHFILQFHEL